ncbi:MAG: T9SS type A sorting domain-containing protein [Bacteroidota bacterium]
MKIRNLILAISILLLQQINAQEYNPIAIEGAQWIVSLDDMNTIEPVDGLWEYYSSGDTTIDDFIYKKIFKRNLVVTQSGPPFQATEPYQLFGLLRDDTSSRKVYAIQLFENFNTCPLNEEYLLFDFSLNIGDTANLCILPEYYEFIIQDIYESNVLGFTTMVFEGPELFYEGVGSNYGLFEEMFAPFKSSSRYIYHTFLNYYCRESPCYLVVSTINSTETQLIEIYPNPTSKTFIIYCNSVLKINSVSIYNILGQKEIQMDNYLNQIDISNLENGIYIIEIELSGKKYRYKIIKE